MRIDRLFGPTSLYRTWVGTAVVGGTALAGVGGILGATAKGPKVSNQFLMNPEYPHSQDARDTWYSKLQDWGKDPNYGAISPDWNNIWDTVQNHIKQYYGGGPLQPGVQQGIDASLARRNMSDSPASDYLHAQVAGQEGTDLSNSATQQGIAQATFGEQGRQNWLNSLEQFQAQKPAGEWQTTVTPNKQAQVGQAIGSVGAGVAGLGIQQQGANNQMDWLKQLMSGGSSPLTFAPGIAASNTAPFNAAPGQYWGGR